MLSALRFGLGDTAVAPARERRAKKRPPTLGTTTSPALLSLRHVALFTPQEVQAAQIRGGELRDKPPYQNKVTPQVATAICEVMGAIGQDILCSTEHPLWGFSVLRHHQGRQHETLDLKLKLKPLSGRTKAETQWHAVIKPDGSLISLELNGDRQNLKAIASNRELAAGVRLFDAALRESYPTLYADAMGQGIQQVPGYRRTSFTATA